jgi:hypothetical protein
MIPHRLASFHAPATINRIPIIVFVFITLFIYLIKRFWVQSYGVLLIAPNFWDILHKNVMNSPSGGSHLPVPRGAFRVINGGINCGNVTNGLVVLGKSATFVPRMNKGHKETISTRFISTAFMVLAIAIFKPFGLEMWQWQASCPSRLPGQPWSGRADHLTFWLYPAAHQALPRITPRLAQQHGASSCCDYFVALR